MVTFSFEFGLKPLPYFLCKFPDLHRERNLEQDYGRKKKTPKNEGGQQGGHQYKILITNVLKIYFGILLLGQVLPNIDIVLQIHLLSNTITRLFSGFYRSISKLGNFISTQPHFNKGAYLQVCGGEIGKF